jgi:tetratricopeptide (TPR) repeat protein
MRFQANARLMLAVALLAMVAVPITAQAGSTVPTFEDANTSFASGNYHTAIAEYRAILEHDGYSAPVLFNLGNAFYRDGQFGAAILNFERAQVLEPGDSEIAANLLQTRQKAGVAAPALNEVERAARDLTPNTLAWTGSLALMAICLAIGAAQVFPRFLYAKVIVVMAAGTMLAVAAAFAIRWPEFDRAIVITANAPARIAPASDAAQSFALKAGEAVTLAKSYGQFILAQTPDGRSGWVDGNELGRVFASDSSSGTHGEI